MILPLPVRARGRGSNMSVDIDLYSLSSCMIVRKLYDSQADILARGAMCRLSLLEALGYVHNISSGWHKETT